MATPTPQSLPVNEKSTLQRAEQTNEAQSRERIPIRTYHCNFCNHLLIASTQDLFALPRRRAPALDNAVILPLPKANRTEDEDDDEGEDEENDEEEGEEEDSDGEDTKESRISRQMKSTTLKQGMEKATSSSSSSSSQHYTILLSTTTPDRKPIILRRADGFEKRLLVRCGRCKVVLGYVLDEVHFQRGDGSKMEAYAERHGDDSTAPGTEDLEVIYVLPGALVETGELGKEVQSERESWAEWESLAKRKK